MSERSDSPTPSVSPGPTLRTRADVCYDCGEVANESDMCTKCSVCSLCCGCQNCSKCGDFESEEDICRQCECCESCCCCWLCQQCAAIFLPSSSSSCDYCSRCLRVSDPDESTTEQVRGLLALPRSSSSSSTSTSSARSRLYSLPPPVCETFRGRLVHLVKLWDPTFRDCPEVVADLVSSYLVSPSPDFFRDPKTTEAHWTFRWCKHLSPRRCRVRITGESKRGWAFLPSLSFNLFAAPAPWIPLYETSKSKEIKIRLSDGSRAILKRNRHKAPPHAEILWERQPHKQKPTHKQLKRKRAPDFQGRAGETEN